MREERLAWYPNDAIVAATRMVEFMQQHGIDDIDELLRRAEAEPHWYWPALLEYFDIRFIQPWSEVLDLKKGIEWPRWCVGGTTNITINCLDRHRDTPAWSQAAIVWEGENGETETWTYAKLSAETDRLARILVARGIGVGDVVAIYLPMIPQAAAAFFAIAKIGAIVMPLFSGFGPQPISERLSDSSAGAVITADVTWRRGKPVYLRDTLVQALQSVPGVHSIIVLYRDDTTLPGASDVEVAWARTSDSHKQQNEELETSAFEPVVVEAETPVMLMYTSGTTGRPKGTIHTHCGVLAKNALDMGLCIDLKSDDRLMWMSDMGWIVGPKVIISSALLGATLVIAEGTPDWPDPVRMWRMVQRHRVSIIGIVPTMVRQMMRNDAERLLQDIDLSGLRATISVGEPWTPQAWEWFFRHVCRETIPILNYAGGTECGGAILIGSFMRPIRPGAFSHPVPGCGADVVDGEGHSLAPGDIGELVLRKPSIGMTRGLWKSPQRYIDSYWRTIPGVWLQGDLASRDEDHLWYLHGRSDDTIKIAGKRTGPSEIEAVLIGTGLVSDAAAVGVPDPLTGSALACACIPVSRPADKNQFIRELAEQVAAQLGAPYRPRHIVLVSDLPRTRNQKIMRRVVRSALCGSKPGDLSSLANPESMAQIKPLTNQAGSRKAPKLRPTTMNSAKSRRRPSDGGKEI